MPASIYGTGTVLMTIADLDEPVFRGTVDEVDVARIDPAAEVRVRIGALADRTFDGRITEIGLRGIARNNAVVFRLEVALEIPDDGPRLRAGYSAVAELVLAEARGALLLPERCVEYRGDGARVLVPSATAGGSPQWRDVTTGVSDGLMVEIVDGLTDRDRVLERDWSPRR